MHIKERSGADWFSYKGHLLQGIGEVSQEKGLSLYRLSLRDSQIDCIGVLQDGLLRGLTDPLHPGLAPDLSLPTRGALRIGMIPKIRLLSSNRLTARLL